ncbi:Box C/D snoRNA accumulation [Saitoella coloradoensis]
MKRARENKTSWNQKRKALSWTIEWIFLIPSTGDEYKILDDRVPDTDTLSEAAAKHLEKDPLLTAHFSEDAPFALQYLLRDVNSPTTARAYIQLDPEHNFKDNLRNCTVLEFPTIVVARDVPPQYTLVPKPNPQHGHDEAPQTKTEIEEEPRIEDVVSMADVVKSLVKDDLAYVAGMAADDDALVPKIFKEEEGVESSSSSSSSEEEEEEDEEETGVQGKEGTHVQAADPAPLVEESEPCPTQL